MIDRGLSLLGDGRVLAPSLLGLDEVVPSEMPRDFHGAKERLVATWERAWLTDLLRRAGGNVSRAARDGGLDRPYLHRLLRKHGIGG